MPRLAPDQRAARDRRKPRIHLIEVERLHQIVVRPGLEPLDPVAHLIARGQNNDRKRITPSPQFPQEVQSPTIR